MKSDMERQLILKSGFTLIEIVMVMVIVGVLAAIAVPMFIRSVEESKNREAVAALRLIRTAERLYYLDYNIYVAATNTNEINTELQLDIESKNWKFRVEVDNAASPPKFTAYAMRTLSSREREFRITANSANVECRKIDCCCYSWPTY